MKISILLFSIIMMSACTEYQQARQSNQAENYIFLEALPQITTHENETAVLEVQTQQTPQAQVQQDLNMTMFINATAGLRVRSLPSTDGKIINTLEYLTEVNVARSSGIFQLIDNVNGAWFFINSPMEGYVFAPHLIHEDLHYNRQTIQNRRDNGIIIDTLLENDTQWTRRIHVQRIRIGVHASAGQQLIVYSDPQLSNGIVDKRIELFRLNRNEIIHSSEIIREDDLTTNSYTMWLKIYSAQGIGWINLGGRDPYANSRWEIIETIVTDNNTWVVRRQESMLAIWEVIAVREKPGLDSMVLFYLEPLLPQYNDGRTFVVEGFAITEEMDRINGRMDHWIKIEDRQSRTGWIFGGDGTVERGGPRFFTPENSIQSRLAWF